MFYKKLALLETAKNCIKGVERRVPPQTKSWGSCADEMMTIAEVLLGVITVASGAALSTGVLLSKSNGKGLSETIGGTSMTMQEKNKMAEEEIIEKVVAVSAVICGASALGLSILAAHM